MKKFTIALMCLLMTAGAAMAQGRKTFGPKVGFDLTNFWGSDIKHGMKPSYQVGVFGEYQFANSNFALATEVVFASQGGQFSMDDAIPGVEADVTFNTNYINVPFLVKYYVTPKVSIDFGPQVGINVYSKMTAKAKAGSLEEKETGDLKDATNAVDFGLGLGATYNIARDVFVQGRYTMGLTHPFKGDANVYNGNIQLAIGYRF